MLPDFSFPFNLIFSGRTFPAHPYYMQTLGPGQLALFNVLKAYSLLDQEVGYCQGLSFVGGILLLHVSLFILKVNPRHVRLVVGEPCPIVLMAHYAGTASKIC